MTTVNRQPFINFMLERLAEQHDNLLDSARRIESGSNVRYYEIPVMLADFVMDILVYDREAERFCKLKVDVGKDPSLMIGRFSKYSGYFHESDIELLVIDLEKEGFYNE
jgi:hypothetical protein